MVIKEGKEKYALALGYFDGLHIAHRKVLEETLRFRENGLVPAVILFDEHPRKVISGDSVPFLLQREKRDEMLRNMGFVCLYVSFSEIMNMSPQEFVDNILSERYSASAVVSGYNYRFGKNGSGDSRTLLKLCEKKCIKVNVCPEITVDNMPVSSTRIRSLIENGEIEKANSLLGFQFLFSSEVFSGDKRGRTLGFPTINQYLPEGLIVPGFGVYAAKVFAEGREYKGVTNIGCRPTFDGDSVRSETYIVDFSGDLYGKTVEIRLCSFLRKEQKFDNVTLLREQIIRDTNAADRYFSEG